MSKEDEKNKKLRDKWVSALSLVPGGMAPAALFYAGTEFLRDLAERGKGHGEVTVSRDGKPYIGPIFRSIEEWESIRFPDGGATISPSDLTEDVVLSDIAMANPWDFHAEDNLPGARKIIEVVQEFENKLPTFPLYKAMIASKMGDIAIEYLDWIAIEAARGDALARGQVYAISSVAPDLQQIAPVSLHFLEQQIEEYGDIPEEPKGPPSKKSSSPTWIFTFASGLLLIAAGSIAAWRVHKGKPAIPPSIRHPLR